MKILTSEAMREVDRRAIEEIGIPSLVLMENAAVGVVDALAEQYPEASSAAVFCGAGNNGGDGLAIARHLNARGYRVELFVIPGREYSADAATQLSVCRNLGLAIVEADAREVARAATTVEVDVLIDALLGTGLERPLEGGLAELVEALNSISLPRVAVDLPTGLSGSGTDLPGPHLRADLTVTFAAPKIAHIFPPAADSVGQVVVADLGFHSGLLAEAPGKLDLLQAAELAPSLSPRRPPSHKGDFGHVLVLAGSVGKTGAAVLTAQAAVRAGAGLVTTAVPTSVVDVVDAGSIESMSLPLSVAADGGLAKAAAAEIADALEGKEVLAAGPGLGTADSTVALLHSVLPEAAVPLVLDADGLNAFAGRLADLASRSAETVLTPHPGELGRLLGVQTAEVEKDRLAAVRAAAAKSGAIVVLKGHLTVIAEPGGDVSVNPTGNPGMATGGSGDVLTGVIASLIAQGHDA
ncbi:MAG: NAD(P)H-hydrate dehydratase, partial [Acidobacteriota bacterium]|nr:NAD(P)H-hydrate dehydratase [Acidobacteriota bacterium]